MHNKREHQAVPPPCSLTSLPSKTSAFVLNNPLSSGEIIFSFSNPPIPFAIAAPIPLPPPPPLLPSTSAPELEPLGPLGPLIEIDLDAAFPFARLGEEGGDGDRPGARDMCRV